MMFGGLGARRQMAEAMAAGMMPGDGAIPPASGEQMSRGWARPDIQDGPAPGGLLAQPPRGLFGGPTPDQAPPTPMQAPQAMPQGMPQGLPQPMPQRGGGFDYGAAQAALLPQKPKGSKFVHTLGDIASILGPALMAANGDQAGANAFIARMAAKKDEASRRQWDTNRMLAEWQHQDYARQNGADLTAAQPFTIGRDRLRYDPQTGQTASIYHGPADFEDYAQKMGFEPGTPEYVHAAQDYILRGNGPTAVGLDMSLDNHRTGNRSTLENQRFQNRSSLQQQGQQGRETLRGLPSYRDTHPLPGRGGGGGRAAGSAPTATGPNGQKIMWNGSAWVPVK